MYGFFSVELQLFDMSTEDITIEVTEARLLEFPDVPNSIIPSSIGEQKLASPALHEENHHR